MQFENQTAMPGWPDIAVFFLESFQRASQPPSTFMMVPFM